MIIYDLNRSKNKLLKNETFDQLTKLTKLIKLTKLFWMKLILLFVVLVFSSDVYWFSHYLHIDFNYNFYKNHSDIIDNYYPCCMMYVIVENGTLKQNMQDDVVEKMISPYIASNVGIIPVISAQNKTTMHQMYNNMIEFSTNATNIALKFKFKGFMIDYEADDFDIKNFLIFLDIFSDIMHKNNLVLHLCVGSWGILKDYQQLSKIKIDMFMNMASYDDSPDSYSWMEELISNVTSSKTSAGIAIPTLNNGWPKKDLQTFIYYLEKNNVTNTGIWWCPEKTIDDIPQYYIDILKKFKY